MDNNKTYELNNEENNNLNININNINNRGDIIPSSETEGNLFLPIQVENYLNVIIFF